MKQITELLGLKPDATVEEAAAAIVVLQTQLADIRQDGAAILSLLGLKADATLKDVSKAIAALQGQIAAAQKQIDAVKAQAAADGDTAAQKLESLAAQVAVLKAAKTGIPQGMDPEDIRRRMAAGLTKSEAIEAATNQAANDSLRGKKKPGGK